MEIDTTELFNEARIVLILIFVLGLLMSVTGFLVNIGFRVNQ